MIIDEALGLESESTLNTESDSELESDELELSNPIKNTEPNMFVFFYVAKICALKPNFPPTKKVVCL